MPITVYNSYRYMPLTASNNRGDRMPRPQKWRKVCAAPRCTRFSPSRGHEESGVVEMTVDEYETIRLIDLEGLTQEQCADRMEVARSTAQSIYQGARKKLADCIVNSRTLVIGGGEYRICEHGNDACRHGKGCCHCHGGKACPKDLRKEVDSDE